MKGPRVDLGKQNIMTSQTLFTSRADYSTVIVSILPIQIGTMADLTDVKMLELTK